MTPAVSKKPDFYDLYDSYYIEGLHRGWRMWETKLWIVLEMLEAVDTWEQLSTVVRGPAVDLLRSLPGSSPRRVRQAGRDDMQG
jgi:hypothetical protein